ncbi:zinc-binding dehydrogenase [Streptomyces sp. NPDC045431]|uniref:zinc-binding dehydrogenase n=1 Tax=Streptomyces sp. NPDC045431 TaxID=3155613 RepID=UPI0033D1C6EF
MRTSLRTRPDLKWTRARPSAGAYGCWASATYSRHPTPHTALAGRALTEAAAGRLRPVIGGAFPLERAADAHAAIENRSLLGKVVLTT